ncbi:hypothetical protein COO60DRAFT_1634485 [Scenedesmus sp. NREL 46B-D3]|nr:hypothetical protein COO60DRAFT_1634485 [Scenedesmus sp. NREL 46B-D3]
MPGLAQLGAPPGAVHVIIEAMQLQHCFLKHRQQGDINQAPHYSLAQLAAAQPLLYFGLLDCSSRCGVDIKTFRTALQAFQQGAQQPAGAMLNLLSQPSAAAALASAVIGLGKTLPHCECVRSSSRPAAAPTAASGTSGGSADIAGLAAQSTNLEGLMAAADQHQAAAEGQQSQAELDQGHYLSSSSSISSNTHRLRNRPEREQLRAWQLCRGLLITLAAHVSKVLQAVVEQPMTAVQQQPAAATAAWSHLLQLHAVPELVAAVGRLQRSMQLEQQARQRQSSTGSGSAGSRSNSSSRNLPGEYSVDAADVLSSYTTSITTTTSSHDEDSCQRQHLPQEQYAARTSDLVSELLSFCRAAAAAVPLPEVCNNPGCKCRGGILEAAAAVKACGACGARYCCRQCQEAAWRQHKAACKRLRSGGGRAGTAGP